MSAEKKIEEATKAKERGTMFLKQDKLKLAWFKYKRVEDILEYEKSMEPEQKKVIFRILVKCVVTSSIWERD